MTRADLHTGSHDLPVSAALDEFMRTGWLDSEQHDLPRGRGRRRGRRPGARGCTRRSPGERMVVPAGGFKQRSNDQYYRFRPHSAYVWLTGDQSSDGVFVIETGRRAPRSTCGRAPAATTASSSATAATASCGPAGGRRWGRAPGAGVTTRHTTSWRRAQARHPDAGAARPGRRASTAVATRPAATPS